MNPRSFIVSSFFLVLFASCEEKQHVPLPETETEWKEPSCVKADTSVYVKAQPLRINRDSCKPPVIRKAGNPLATPDGSNLFHPILKQEVLHVNKPIYVPLPRLKTKAFKPVYVFAGQPIRYKLEHPRMMENAVVNLKYLSQDEGLPGTHIQCSLMDKNGRVWLGTDNGLAILDGENVYVYTSKEGLSHNNIWSLLEDNKGNIWIGTSGGGLNIFDGKCFAHFGSKEGLGYNNVSSLLQDSQGKIWIGTNGGGISVFDGTSSYSQITSKEGLCMNSVLCMTQDLSGKIWIGTNGGGLSVFDGHGFFQYSAEEGLISNLIVCLLKDAQGKIWIGSRDQGLCTYDGKTFSRFLLQGLIDHKAVNCMLQDKKGQTWVGTQGTGVDVYSQEGMTSYTKKQGLTDDFIGNLLEDPNGNIWIGTDGGGINIFDRKTITHYSDKEGLSSNSPRNLLQDKKGNIWIGTKGAGLNLYDGEQFKHFTVAEGLTSNTVKSLMEDKAGHIWIGTEDGGVDVYDGKEFTTYNIPQGLGSHSVLSLLEDQSGRILIGTRNDGLKIIDGNQIFAYGTKEGLSGVQIVCMARDAKNRIWIGIKGKGVNVFDGKGFYHFSTKQGLGNDFVNCLHPDKKGNMWIGTDGGGISVFDGSQFICYATEQGLSDNSVVQITEDSAGVIYAGTGKGLTCFVPNVHEHTSSQKLIPNYRIVNYHKPDGLKYEDFNGPGAPPLNDKSGNIWFSIGKVITRMIPEKQTDSVRPKLYITQIDLGGKNTFWSGPAHPFSAHQAELNASAADTIWMSNRKTFYLRNSPPADSGWLQKAGLHYSEVSQPYPLPEKLVLPYNQNHLTFNFTGIRFGDWGHIRYRYIMQGAESSWSPITNKSEADYRNLLPGNYTFRVAARGSNSLWSAPVSFRFTVLPPWWQTWPAYFLYFLIGLLSVWSFVKWRERRLKREKQVLEEKVEVRTSQLQEEKQNVESQKTLVEHKNKEITDSINYAERLQRAILPPVKELKEIWPESFLIYTPKDIVAGDFYWMQHFGDFTLIAAADCTGHGVPGALVSVVCSNALNRTVNEFGIKLPGPILDKVRELVLETFAKSESEVKDGMDISLASVNTKTGEVLWAGANNPLWYIQSGEFKEIKPDKQPIGKSSSPFPFHTQTIQLLAGDKLYLFTDGLPDQFGGPRGKKFMYKQFKELLAQTASLSMEEQSLKLKTSFDQWKGTLEQVDDVCVIGVCMPSLP